MTCAAVIPHWNRKHLLAALLQNLSQQTRRFDRIIVADNGSTDGSAEMAEQAGATVVRMGRNLGFAAAVNRGIGLADADWIAILNNDVTLDPKWLENLLAGAERQEVWFATGKILRAASPPGSPPGSNEIIDATFDEISRGACAWRCGSGRFDSPRWNKLRSIRIAPMTAALFRRQLFQEVGPLDESFESYLEDVDFGLRCAGAGKAGVYIPGAVAWHLGSATLGEWNNDTVRRIARNQVLLAKKHFGVWAWWPILAGQLLWGVVACRHGRGWSYFRGKLQGLLAKAAQPAKRADPAAVRAVVEQSERAIFDLQTDEGSFDSYWRVYFWLSRR